MPSSSMTPLAPAPNIPLDLDPIDRWTVYHRLQELSIPCQCCCGEPLKVAIASPTTVLQVWGVIRRVTSSREAAIAALETCWNQVTYR
jgi:hypothetical protein